MSASADFSHDRADDGGVLRFTGNLSLSAIGDLPERLNAVDGPVARIDLSQVDRIDTVGAWLVHRFARDRDVTIDGLNADSQHLFDQVAAADDPVVAKQKALSPPLRVLEEIGEAVSGSARQLLGLLGFLIGMVIAQQGAVQLRQFGAEVFTINLVGRLTFRELGVLMTAIMVAGRSGSAFAAQLGTMKLTEEIDAMRTIGVSPMEALVLPRVIAAIVMMLLLGFYASIIAIIGGALLSWAQLGIPFVTFITRIREVVPITDLYIGLIKAPVFGAIIGIAGCFHGMQVEGDAEQVGGRTTAAVVQAIFLVIVLDAFFAIFFAWIGWI